jgi:glycosyltransferase involved in cell wall biosynthesis
LKILLISNYLPDRQESMHRYASMLAQELRGRGHSVALVHPPQVLGRFMGRKFPAAKWIGYIDKYLLAPGSLRAQCRKVDVVHVCDHSNSMYLGLAGATPSLITCHDLLAIFAAQGRFPGQSTGLTGRVLQRWIAGGLLRASSVVCVSAKTERDLRELANGEPPPTFVVHHPLNWDFHPVQSGSGFRVLSNRGLHGADSYFLHIGNNSWYKNRQAVVHIFAELKRADKFSKAKLVLAGKPCDEALRAVIASSGVAADILELGSVTNEELRALYSDATALLFPSREEGFGWPILEAQACGCPVITTDRAPMTEIAGTAAILIDSDDTRDAAQCILKDQYRFPQLKEEGLRNVERFTVKKAMDEYESIYRDVIAGQSASSYSETPKHFEGSEP